MNVRTGLQTSSCSGFGNAENKLRTRDEKILRPRFREALLAKNDFIVFLTLEAFFKGG